MKRHLAGIKSDVAARPIHRLGRLGLGPKQNSTQLDWVVQFRTHIWVGSDISGNRLDGSKLLVSRVWASDWAKILDIVKIIVILFFGAFLAKITQFGSLINHIDFRFFEFPIYISNWASFYLIYFKIGLQAQLILRTTLDLLGLQDISNQI